jgi:hypothetical protein
VDDVCCVFGNKNEMKCFGSIFAGALCVSIGWVEEIRLPLAKL